MKPPLVKTFVTAASVDPSGLRIETVLLLIVTPVIVRLTRPPATPSNVRRAFSPGAVVVTVTAGPPGTITTGTLVTSLTVTVALPVAGPCGSRRIVYVPAAGSVLASMKPPLVPTFMAGTRTVPSGLMIDTFVLQQV